MGNGAKSWFRRDGRYTDTEVARDYGDFALRIVGASVTAERPGPVRAGQ
jgi:hypothetical protein